jgi:hypothetical protein
MKSPAVGRSIRTTDYTCGRLPLSTRQLRAAGALTESDRDVAAVV